MLTVRYHPELATPRLYDWLRPRVKSYENSSGRQGMWLVQAPETLPVILAAVGVAVCPEVDPRDWHTVSLQCYEDGRAVTPCHTDRVGLTFILSLGATRTFRVHRMEGRPATEACTALDRETDRRDIECAPGTVVMIDEEFYSGWHHEIPLEPDRQGERLALVFRQKPRPRVG